MVKPTLDPSSKLTLDSRIRFRRFEDEGIVVNQKTAEALVISDVATRMLEMMAGGTRTLQECAVLLAEEFDADVEVIERDVVRFASELVDIGVAAAS